MKETSIIELAGHRIALCGGDSVYQNFWSGYLATQSDAEPELTISYSDKQVNGIPVGSGATSRYFLIHKAISDFLLTKNVLTVHGSSLLFEGKAYLFCAPSGTGKSTHTGLWRAAFAEVVRRFRVFAKSCRAYSRREYCPFRSGSVRFAA